VPKTEEIAAWLTKLCNEKLHNVYSFKSWRMRLARYVLRAGENRKNTPLPLVRKRNIPTERPPLSAKFCANFC
jgi:hypothetical protein